MAAASDERNLLRYGKLLPPITLSDTSTTGLLSLVPVLVAMTSNSAMPKFGEESDRPPWWPHDVQWKNPNDYCYMGEMLLGKILRKVIHSCYSYHGVEDLLCRLDDSPKDEESTATISNLEGDGNANTSNTDTDGPIFVCCFCLEEFDSHKIVSAHQRVCQDKSQANDSGTALDNADTSESIHAKQTSSHSTSDTVKISADTSPHPISLSVSLYHLSNNALKIENKEDSPKIELTQQSKPDNTSTKKQTAKPSASSRRQPAANVVESILKTRSQKRLDQIMERHRNKRLMLQECRELKEVPKSGAWWVNRKSQKCRVHGWVHPSEKLTKQEFFSGIGMSVKKVKPEQSNASSIVMEVDLDCEIISVEGPISLKFTQDDCSTSNDHTNALSPRGKSLMSQMSRDDSTRSSRRRISSLCFVEDEWADREAINEGRDPRRMCLMTLDLSSPLGQRIRKFVKVDRPMNVVRDIESSCCTENSGDKVRLRAGDYKVTYRKKCRATSWVHKYKFNKYQIREFKRHLRTGLSSRSRYLKRMMGNCKVLLRQITDKDIELYNMEKKVTIAQNIVVDDDLCITQIDIPEDGLNLLKNQPNQTSAPDYKPYFSNVQQSQSSASNDPSKNRQFMSSHQPNRPPQHHHHHKLQQKQFQSRHSSADNFPSNHHRPSLPPSLYNRNLPNHLRRTSTNHCPSPPHVPNIFRNRSSPNTSSPPHRTSKDSHMSFKQAVSYLQERHSSHHRNHLNHLPHHHHHHNRHQHHSNPNPHRQQKPSSGSSSPPLGFSSGVIISERRQIPQRHPVVSNSNSRRKQPMNQVRQDDSSNFVSSKPHHSRLDKVTDKKEAFINLTHEPYSPDSRTNQNKILTPSHPTWASLSSKMSPHNSSTPTSKKESFLNLADEASINGSSTASSSHHQNRSQGRQPSGLNSNNNKMNTHTNSPNSLQHFSIKQGKITSGHSLPSSNNTSQLRGMLNDSSLHYRNIPNFLPSMEKSHHNHQSTSQRQQLQESPQFHTKNVHHRPTPGQQSTSSNSNNHSTGQSRVPQTQNDDKGQRPKPKIGPRSFQIAQQQSNLQQHRHQPSAARPQPPKPPLSFPTSKPTKLPPPPSFVDDDDIMEVICIDD